MELDANSYNCLSARPQISKQLLQLLELSTKFALLPPSRNVKFLLKLRIVIGITTNI